LDFAKIKELKKRIVFAIRFFIRILRMEKIKSEGIVKFFSVQIEDKMLLVLITKPNSKCSFKNFSGMY